MLMGGRIMRKSVFFWLLLATFCGIVLFHTSQKVHDERVKISLLQEEIIKEQESIRVLEAEWGYLNQPERLEKLARNYLHLAPLKGHQFAKLEDIPLKALGEAAPVASPPEEEVKISKHLPPASLELKENKKAPAAPLAAGKSKPAAASSANSRKFGDVMKGLAIE
jgi:hypothetical protein